ncbi:hypothetical protein Taro_045480 [Colocasia esculenta]|uniref:Uncharacterized protein n=1 Tax=Colocasia esculenta TaxID=4460 RepID=A0A843WPK6_COLES|nr:hypothetical protein [Colocasia esculenta]
MSTEEQRPTEEQRRNPPGISLARMSTEEQRRGSPLRGRRRSRRRVRLPIYTGRPGDRDCLPDHVGRPGNRVRLLPSSITFPIPITTRGREPSSSKMRRGLNYLDTSHAGFLGTIGSPFRWATGPWQERSQAAKRNRAAHPEKNVHTSGSVSYATHSQKSRHELERASTFRELFDQTHKWKGTDDYVSESARTIAGDGRSLCRGHSLARLGSEGLGQHNGRAEEGSSVRIWGQPRYHSSVVLICEFGWSPGLREFICCAAQQWWRGHENPHLGRATAAVWPYGRAADHCHPRSRPLTASPSA